MKTIRSFSMTFNPMLSACLVLAVSWSVMTVPRTSLGKPPGRGKGGGKPQVTKVAVTIDGDVVSNGLYRVRSDGMGEYINKQDKVHAVLDDGRFRFATWDSKTRGMILDIPEDVRVVCALEATQLPPSNLSTRGINLTNMMEGSSLTAEVIITFSDNHRQHWQLIFDGVSVTRNYDDTNGTSSWDIINTGLADLVKLGGKPNDPFPPPCDPFFMPFSITVRTLFPLP